MGGPTSKIFFRSARFSAPRDPFFYMLALALLTCVLAANAVADAQSKDSGEGMQLARDGTNPTLRFPVAHAHAMGICVGYLYISRDEVRYEAVGPDNAHSDSFDFRRDQIQDVRSKMGGVQFHSTVNNRNYLFAVAKASVVENKSNHLYRWNTRSPEELIKSLEHFDEILALARERAGQGGTTAAATGGSGVHDAPMAEAKTSVPGASPADTPSIGVLVDSAAGSQGAMIIHALRNGPAKQAGLAPGDVIAAINDSSIKNEEEFSKRLSSFSPGATITIRYLRQGAQTQASVTVMERSKLWGNVDVYDKETVEDIRALAEKGIGPTQNMLGSLYERGLGVPQDYGQAASWYRKAAEQGNADAQDGLGWLYFQGHGVPQDYTQATLWLTKAANRGNPHAARGLAWLYATGNGVLQDYDQAASLWLKAASQGDSIAEHNLGLSYWGGRGVQKDYVQAVNWFRKAGEQGNVDSQEILVKIYRSGIQKESAKCKGDCFLIPKDETQVIYWQGKLLEQKTKNFEQFRQRAEIWRATNPKPPLDSMADREWILAENATKEKNLDSATQHYEVAVRLQPMWPVGWFNLAMIYGEQNKYAEAADRMRHYLELVPDAPDATNARAQMIIWEDKARH